MATSTRFIALASAARTTSGSVDLGELGGDYDEALIYLDATAVAGTSPSLTVTYQTSPNGVDYYDNTASTAINAVGRQVIKLSTCIGSYGRLNFVITGTAPSITFSAVVEVKRRGT